MKLLRTTPNFSITVAEFKEEHQRFAEQCAHRLQSFMRREIQIYERWVTSWVMVFRYDTLEFEPITGALLLRAGDQKYPICYPKQFYKKLPCVGCWATLKLI